MSNHVPDDHQQPTESSPNSEQNELQLQQPSRRKLLRKATLVGLPAVATLASRPVLAWHCRTPSMWGSMVINPATSLRTNTGHQTGYKDETWTIVNWGRNQGRVEILSGKAPWDYLLASGLYFTKFSYALTTTQPLGSYVILAYSSRGVPNKFLDLSLFKVADLCANTGITLPIGVSTSTTVTALLEQSYTTFGAHLVVAQLNFKYLANIAGTSYLDTCIGGGRMNLASVALTGSFTSSTGEVWGQAKIIDYLQNNWIVVPYDGYVTWSTDAAPDIGVSTGTITGTSQPYHYFSFPIKIN